MVSRVFRLRLHAEEAPTRALLMGIVCLCGLTKRSKSRCSSSSPTCKESVLFVSYPYLTENNPLCTRGRKSFDETSPGGIARGRNVRMESDEREDHPEIRQDTQSTLGTFLARRRPTPRRRPRRNSSKNRVWAVAQPIDSSNRSGPPAMG